MKARPYVGITGPVSVLETRALCEEFAKADYSMESPHIPMIGFLVSYKTLNGESVKNRRYPPVDLLPALLHESSGKVLNMIHYNSRDTGTLSCQVAKIFNGTYEEDLCRALQLNIAWPDVRQVEKMREKYPDMQIVFQASDKVMRGKTPNQIAWGIKDYNDLVDYVLIDPSEGRGESFDLESSIAVYSELREQCPGLTIGFAGGFTGENVALKSREIIRRTGEDCFCTDAEGGVRDKVGDDLNLVKFGRYLWAASLVLK